MGNGNCFCTSNAADEKDDDTKDTKNANNNNNNNNNNDNMNSMKWKQTMSESENRKNNNKNNVSNAFGYDSTPTIDSIVLNESKSIANGQKNVNITLVATHSTHSTLDTNNNYQTQFTQSTQITQYNNQKNNNNNINKKNDIGSSIKELNNKLFELDNYNSVLNNEKISNNMIICNKNNNDKHNSRIIERVDSLSHDSESNRSMKSTNVDINNNNNNNTNSNNNNTNNNSNNKNQSPSLTLSSNEVECGNISSLMNFNKQLSIVEENDTLKCNNNSKLEKEKIENRIENNNNNNNSNNNDNNETGLQQLSTANRNTTKNGNGISLSKVIIYHNNDDNDSNVKIMDAVSINLGILKHIKPETPISETATNELSSLEININLDESQTPTNTVLMPICTPTATPYNTNNHNNNNNTNNNNSNNKSENKDPSTNPKNDLNKNKKEKNGKNDINKNNTNNNNNKNKKNKSDEFDKNSSNRKEKEIECDDFKFNDDFFENYFENDNNNELELAKSSRSRTHTRNTSDISDESIHNSRNSISISSTVGTISSLIGQSPPVHGINNDDNDNDNDNDNDTLGQIYAQVVSASSKPLKSMKKKELIQESNSNVQGSQSINVATKQLVPSESATATITNTTTNTLSDSNDSNSYNNYYMINDNSS